jgi:hypothetical protein
VLHHIPQRQIRGQQEQKKQTNKQRKEIYLKENMNETHKTFHTTNRNRSIDESTKKNRHKQQFARCTCLTSARDTEESVKDFVNIPGRSW